MSSETLILPRFELLNSHSQQVKDITLPLQKMGITLFSHTRVYKDNSFIDISDRADMLDYFYYQTDMYKYYFPDVNPWMFKEKFFLCNTMENNPSIKALKDDLKIDNIITLIEQYDTHCELFHFGTTPHNHKIINLYLNNIDVLKAFTLFFKDKAQSLIHESEQHRIKRPVDVNEFFNLNSPPNEKMDKNEFYRNLSMKEVQFKYHGQLIKFTLREIQILKWAILGKSSSEISIILNISRRTSENHLNNIKHKLGCHKITDVIRTLMEAGIMEMIIKLF